MHESITLGELLRSPNKTIKRHALGIRKELERCNHDKYQPLSNGKYKTFKGTNNTWHARCETCKTTFEVTDKFKV